jgi:hypothetical protein
MELAREKLCFEGILLKQQRSVTFLKNYTANRYYTNLETVLAYSKSPGILT